MRIFWDVAPRSLVGVDRYFRGAFCLHHQGVEFQLFERLDSGNFSSSFFYEICYLSILLSDRILLSNSYKHVIPHTCRIFYRWILASGRTVECTLRSYTSGHGNWPYFQKDVLHKQTMQRRQSETQTLAVDTLVRNFHKCFPFCLVPSSCDYTNVYCTLNVKVTVTPALNISNQLRLHMSYLQLGPVSCVL
jgi:hypothetical protein